MSESANTGIVSCGCGASVGDRTADEARMDGAEAEGAETERSARHATAVDPEIKKRNLSRLRRIEGQVRGLQRMVEEERWCADVLTQVSSVQEALRGVSRELLRNHLRHCAASAAREGPESSDAVNDEIVELMFRYAR